MFEKENAMVFIIIISALIILALLISFYETRHFVVKKYCIRDKYFNDKKIKTVFISDLHDCSYGKNNEKLIEAIDNIKPDFVFFGGDIFNGIRNKKNVNAESFVKTIAFKYRCFYALGNHEFRYYLYPDEFPGLKDEFLKILSDADVKLLDNESEITDINGVKFCISGLSIERRFYKRFKADKMPEDYVENVLDNSSKEGYSILLAHNPRYMKNYAAGDFDLILSGHYHGGLMRIFNQGMVSPDYKLLPKYSYGIYKINKSTAIVSGGLGVHTLPFRIFNRPELVEIEFKG